MVRVMGSGLREEIRRVAKGLREGYERLDILGRPGRTGGTRQGLGLGLGLGLGPGLRLGSGLAGQVAHGRPILRLRHRRVHCPFEGF